VLLFNFGKRRVTGYHRTHSIIHSLVVCENNNNNIAPYGIAVNGECVPNISYMFVFRFIFLIWLIPTILLKWCSFLCARGVKIWMKTPRVNGSPVKLLCEEKKRRREREMLAATYEPIIICMAKKKEPFDINGGMDGTESWHLHFPPFFIYRGALHPHWLWRQINVCVLLDPMMIFILQRDSFKKIGPPRPNISSIRSHTVMFVCLFVCLFVVITSFVFIYMYQTRHTSNVNNDWEKQK